MWDSVIAVLGTLAGAVVAGLIQQRAARQERQEARRETRQREQQQALTGLVAALADHRRAMWTREDLRLSDADGEAYRVARAASHATRAGVTAPQVALSVLAPELAEPVKAAVSATYALRGAADHAVLESQRAEAGAACDRLVAAAAALFA